MADDKTAQLAVNTIRTLSMDAVQAAKSGHSGTPMALAPLVYTIWNRAMRFDPQDPIWPNRDRFVLSNGHASMLVWSILHLTGVRAVSADYERLGNPSVTLDDIRHFRQLDSKAPGHPGYRWVSGVETTTRPLGQGVATSVGMAETWSLGRAAGTLLAATVLVAWMSEILVGAAEGTGKALGQSQAFTGIVFLAIIGGAAQSGPAVVMAQKNKMDLTVGMLMGSCVQMVLFVVPVLVLASFFMSPQPLQLSFSSPETGSLFIGVIIATLVCGDGRSNWDKGVQLITVYLIIALLFYLIPQVSR